jgi:hypothetical protein
MILLGILGALLPVNVISKEIPQGTWRFTSYLFLGVIFFCYSCYLADPLNPGSVCENLSKILFGGTITLVSLLVFGVGKRIFEF